jgi:hypothetical protein
MEQRLDFDLNDALHDDRTINHIFTLNKLKQICQAVDNITDSHNRFVLDIGMRVKDIEKKLCIIDTINALDSNSIQTKIEELSERLDKFEKKECDHTWNLYISPLGKPFNKCQKCGAIE